MDTRKPLRRSAPVETENDGIIEGRNAVVEALRAGVTIDKIYILKGETDATLGHIASTAREKGVVVVDADRRKLDGMSRTHSHQGVIAVAAAREYASVDDILNIAREKGEAPLIVVCDELSDPHNLGAVIRTADAAGAHGVIIPKRRSAGLTAVVAKTSAGAVAHVPVARVPNITALLKQLKDEGVWVFGTAAQGNTSLYKADLKGPAAIVIGSEGDGMSRLVAENCDFTVSIPMFGKINSLNASAAAAVLLEANTEGLGIVDSILHSDGSGEMQLYMKAGGSRYPASIETVQNNWHTIMWDGHAVFKAAVSKMSDVSVEMMERHNLKGEDIRFLVPHQANLRIIDATARRMGITQDKCMINIDRNGNTTAATIPSCLCDYESQLRKGDNLILSAFGGGYTWGATYVKWAYDGLKA